MTHKRLSARLSPAIGAILLAGLAFSLRLHRLDLQPLWGDEGWSFYFASMDVAPMIRATAEDIHPPLYYALLAGWLWLAGSTPEIARFMSIICGTLLVPLAYRIGARLFDRTVGLITAAVVTLSPFAIYYSQEVRMYGLVTLLGLGSVFFFSQQTAVSAQRSADHPSSRRLDGRARRLFWGYVLTTSAALYTMYYAAFIPVFQLVFFVASHYRQRLRSLITHPFVRSLSIALLLYLPWVAYAGGRLFIYVQGKRMAEGYTPLDLPRFVAAHLVAFSLGHLSQATHILAWATLLCLPVALFSLAYRAARVPRPIPLIALYLTLPLLLGYLINRIYPFTPPYFERTLMLAAPAWWLLLGAGFVWLWRRSRLALAALGAGLLGIQTIALLDLYNVPRYQDQDYRPLMAYVRTHSSPQDVFLASYQWQVGFYYAYLPAPRPELYIVPGWGETWAADPSRMQANLDALIRDHPRLWFPAYQALGRLWEVQAERYLNQVAFPVQADWRIPSTKLLCYVRGEHMAAARAPANFANRLLVQRAEVGHAPLEAGRDVAPVVLVWQKLGSLGSDHRVALRLADPGGRTWASRDSLPQGGNASFTDLAVGQQLIDRHGLVIPAGTPPGEYQLRLSVYDAADDRPLDLLDAQGQPQGTEAILARLQVIPPRTSLAPNALAVQYQTRLDFDRQVRLLGYSLGHGPFRAGDSLGFSLFWQALTDVREAYIVFAQLQDASGQPVALSETPPVYPSDRWSAGTLLRDPHEIPLPATLPEGSYRLAIGLLRPDRSRLPVGGGDQVVLTDVQTVQRPHSYSPPVPEYAQDAYFGGLARLVGYELHGETGAQPGQSLTLILYWQALGTFDRRYSIFTHIVDSQGRIVGQRDQTPGNGEFPTTSWVSGEYLTDTYAIPINPGTPPGAYWIEVGFYDPLDGTRLPVTSTAGQSLGDRLLLEKTPVRVE